MAQTLLTKYISIDVPAFILVQLHLSLSEIFLACFKTQTAYGEREHSS